MPKDLGNAQDLVVIEDIKENAVVLKDGGLRQVIMVSGVNFALRSEEEQNIITRAYQNFLNSVDFPLQIAIHSRKVNIEKYLENISRHASPSASPLLENQTNEYKEFIRNFVAKNAIMEKIFLIIVPFVAVALPGKESIAGVTNMIPFLKKTKEKQKEAEDKKSEQDAATFEASLAQLKQRVNQVTEGLFAVGLEAVVLNNEQLIELYYNFYNPETIEKEELNLPQKQA